MKRMSKMVGLPVVMEKTGKRIGRIERICLSADGQNVGGVIVAMFGLYRRRRFIEVGNILLWGEVSLLIKSHCQIPKEFREDDTKQRVYSTEGSLLGWMTDALIDETDSRVRAIEISFGFFDDLLRGRSFVHDFTLRPCGVIAVLRESGELSPDSPL